jgi:hypothetical protein
MRDEVLQRLVRPRVAQPAMHRLHRLAGAVVDETRQIATRRIPLDVPAEAGRKLIGKPAEALQHRTGVGLRHACHRREVASVVQVRNTEPRCTND